MNEIDAAVKQCKRCKNCFPYYVLEQNSGFCGRCYFEATEKGRLQFAAIKQKNAATCRDAEEKANAGWVPVVVLSGILLFGFISCMESKMENPNADEISIEKPKMLKLLEDEEHLVIGQGLAWVIPVKRSCELYKDAPNEIIKSEIYNVNQSYISTVIFQDVEMWIKGLSTTKGGGELDLRLRSKHNDLMFIEVGIERGSAVYNMSKQFNPLECVKASGRLVRSASILEESSVCLPHFQVGLINLGKCD